MVTIAITSGAYGCSYIAVFGGGHFDQWSIILKLKMKQFHQLFIFQHIKVF